MDALRQSIEATKKGERPAEARGDGGRRTSKSAKKPTKAKTASRRRSPQKGRKLKKAS